MDNRTSLIAAQWLDSHKSTSTRDAYARDWKSFTRWCEEANIGPLDITRAQLGAWRDHLRNSSSAATAARRVAAISSFLRYAVEAGDLSTNPARFVTRPEVESPDRVLTAGEQNLLLASAQDQGTKTAALVSLLLFEGINLSKALNLNAPSLVGRALWVGNDRRPLDERTVAALRAHLGQRTTGPLITGQGGSQDDPSRLTRFGADYLLKRAGTSAGVDVVVNASLLIRTHRFDTRPAVD